MAYQRRSTNPDRVTLDFDPVTSDALTVQAKARNVTRQRLAYELVQQGLGVNATVSTREPIMPEDDPTGELVNRISNQKPPGRA